MDGRRGCWHAVTVLVHPGDNWMIHVAVEQCNPATSWWSLQRDNTDGMFGDLLATSLMARGVKACDRRRVVTQRRFARWAFRLVEGDFRKAR